jgi:uncharacterized protein (DUF58 family)
LLLARLGRLSLMARSVVEGAIAGLHRSPYRGLSLEFTSHRAYAPGDEIRRIDWKAFGRLDRFFVKEYEEETNLRAHVLVDASASMAYGGAQGKYGYASLLACALVYLLLRQRDSVGLTVYGEETRGSLPARSTFNHLEACARELERHAPGGTGDTASALEALASGLRKRGLIILVSDLLDEPERLFVSLQKLRHRRHDAIVMQVLHRDELGLPFDEPTLFLDMETPLRVAADAAEVRREYRRLIDRHVATVRQACHANRVDHALFVTSEPLEQSLVRYLSRREGR